MLVEIRDVLTPAQLGHFRAVLGGASWVDGRITAGHQSALAKHNQQLAEDDPAAQGLGQTILAALERSPLFMTAALPSKVFPPLFNRYGVGQDFGTHIDNAIRQIKGTPHRVRTDLSATLFLNEPDEYDGGELAVEDTYGTQRIKLKAGNMVLYPASSLHKVEPVTRGIRLASFFWIQSMVRDDGERALLFDLDMAIQGLVGSAPQQGAAVQLTGIYHNLLRSWAEA